MANSSDNSSFLGRIKGLFSGEIQDSQNNANTPPRAGDAFQKHKNKKIAVFVDTEDALPDDLPHVMESVASEGQITVRRYFAKEAIDTTNDKWFPIIHKLAFRPTELTNGPFREERASDVAFTIDAVHTMISQDIDVFVLVTSDPSFTPLVQVLKKYGKTVFAFGAANASETLKLSCDQYFESPYTSHKTAGNKLPREQVEAKPTTPTPTPKSEKLTQILQDSSKAAPSQQTQASTQEQKQKVSERSFGNKVQLPKATAEKTEPAKTNKTENTQKKDQAKSSQATKASPVSIKKEQTNAAAKTELQTEQQPIKATTTETKLTQPKSIAEPPVNKNTKDGVNTVSHPAVNTTASPLSDIQKQEDKDNSAEANASAPATSVKLPLDLENSTDKESKLKSPSKKKRAKKQASKSATKQDESDPDAPQMQLF